MPATPVTVKFTKKQLELIDEAAKRAGFKTRSTAVKSFMWHGLNALIAQWRDEDMETAMKQWQDGELRHGGDRKSEKFDQKRPPSQEGVCVPLECRILTTSLSVQASHAASDCD